MKIREIDPQSDDEVLIVAQRMRQTLVEVLGSDKGESMYSMDWLINRVRWHLDPKNTHGKVFLIENQEGTILGHGIARIDHGTNFCYFSTIFVEPSSRRKGLATQLINHVEDWFLRLKVVKIIYNTAKNHSAIISLFKSHGYFITKTDTEMIELSKFLKYS